MPGTVSIQYHVVLPICMNVWLCFTIKLALVMFLTNALQYANITAEIYIIRLSFEMGEKAIWVLHFFIILCEQTSLHLSCKCRESSLNVYFIRRANQSYSIVLILMLDYTLLLMWTSWGVCFSRWQFGSAVSSHCFTLDDVDDDANAYGDDVLITV